MASVQEHYDSHLAPHYAWIYGVADAALGFAVTATHSLITLAARRPA